MEYTTILGWTIVIMILLALIASITKATKTTKDDKVGGFISRLLEAFLGWLEKIVPFYKRNK